MASIPDLSYPPRIVDGDVATVEQGSIEEIQQCVEAVLHTIVGSRIDAPEYGIPNETFKQLGPDENADVYLAAIEEAEPRAHLIGRARIEEMVKRVTIERAQST